MEEPNKKKRQRVSEEDTMQHLLTSMASQQQMFSEQLMQIRNVLIPHPNQGATPTTNSFVEHMAPTPPLVEEITKRQTFILSIVESSLFKDGKKLYTKLFDTMYTTKEGLQKLEKHALDGTVPTSMRIKPLLVSSSQLNYDSIFSLPNDIDATVDAPVQTRVKALKDQADADLRSYQAQHVQRCIDDKRYHIRLLDNALATFNTEIVKKWTRQLTNTHGDDTGVMVQRIAHQFSSWQRDFIYLRKQVCDAKNSNRLLQAAKKAATEQATADKYAKFTPVELVMEALRLSSKTNNGKKHSDDRKKPRPNSNVPRKKPKLTNEASKNVKSAAGKRAVSTQAQRKPMTGSKSKKKKEVRGTAARGPNTRGRKAHVKANGKGKGKQ